MANDNGRCYVGIYTSQSSSAFTEVPHQEYQRIFHRPKRQITIPLPERLYQFPEMTVLVIDILDTCLTQRIGFILLDRRQHFRLHLLYYGSNDVFYVHGLCYHMLKTLMG